MNAQFSLSIVSHGHRDYVHGLLNDLAKLGRTDIEVVLTLNIPENLPDGLDKLPFDVTIIRNDFPKGLAANHNAAFNVSQGDYFAILNPDIQLIGDPFDAMLSLIGKVPDCICAPLIINGKGDIEDSARTFPTPLSLARRVLHKVLRFDIEEERVPRFGHVLVPDWVAGMFVVVSRSTYERLGGLSERYFLYFEDVDFCARAYLAGYKVFVNENARVIHHAQRDSHRKLRYFLWHLHSAYKFFASSVYRDVRIRKNEAIAQCSDTLV